MLLTISTTHEPATDLGFLLHKNPSRLQTDDLPFGKVHVFYPVADNRHCTAALLLDVNPVEMIRGRGRRDAGDALLDQYVNDRPYVASSFLSVAIARMWGTALSGRSKERPELAATPIPLRAGVSALPCRGGENLLRRLYEPLGYEVHVVGHTLDETFPDWGESRYFGVTLNAVKRLSELLAHLYVLIPVLDDEKHYWVGEAEVEKLLHRGEGWLASHPERDLIARRYLRHQRGLSRQALARLLGEEDAAADSEKANADDEERLEKPVGLNEQRIGSVLAALKQAGAASVIDLGCGEGKLLRALLKDKSFRRLAGLDVSIRALEIARSRLKLDRLPDHQKDRIQFLHGALTYRDKRLSDFDAAAVVEVIEHLDAPRLAAFERVLFEFAQPRAIVVTTPNVEYNVRFAGLPAGRLRHRDHRFEWTRDEFRRWAESIASRFNYDVRFLPIGPDDPETGPPTQMAVFTRSEVRH